MNSFSFVIANTQSSASGYSTLIMMLLLIVVFWLFFIRPQVKKNKELQKFRQNLKKGQKIITIGGIHGKIVDIDDTTVIIECEGQTRLKIEKAAVAAEFNPEQLQK